MNGPRAWRLVAGAGTVVLLVTLGVVGVQAHEVASCWRDFSPTTGGGMFPQTAPAYRAGVSTDPVTRAVTRQDDWRTAAAFTGDAVFGTPVWTLATQGSEPEFSPYAALLATRSGAGAFRGIAMYEGNTGQRHWMRVADRALGYVVKDGRAVTLVPSAGNVSVMGSGARSGFLQWCATVPGTATVTQPPGEPPGWATVTTGDGRGVLVATLRGNATLVTRLDAATGQTVDRLTVPGRWTQVTADGDVVVLADAAGHLVAQRGGGTLWRAGTVAGPASFVATRGGLVLVAGGGRATAYALTTGAVQWSVALPDPGDATAVDQGPLLVRETRGGEVGVAAYRYTDGAPLWFTRTPGLTSLTLAANDGSLLYLPGAEGPRVLRLADGRAVKTSLDVPVDRVLVSGGRLIVQRDVPGSVAWAMAFRMPGDTQDTADAFDPSLLR